MTDSNDTDRDRVTRRRTLKGLGAGAAALVGVTSQGAAASQNNVTTPVTTFGYDNANTHHAPSRGPRNLTKKWRFKAYAQWQPLVTNNSVYAACRFPGKLFALNIEDGTERWSIDTNDNNQIPPSAPTVVDDTVYVGPWYNGNKMFALDAETGAVKWKTPIGGGYGHHPKVENGVLYTANGTVRALDAETGEKMWSYEIQPEEDGTWANRPIAVKDGIVYVTHREISAPHVIALDAETGEEVWTHDAGYRTVAAPSIHNGTLYVGRQRHGGRGVDPQMFALDAKTGEKLWGFVPNRHVLYSAAVTDDTVFFGTSSTVTPHDSDSVYAVDAETGEKRWRNKIGSQDAPPIFAGGKVYIGNVTSFYSDKEPQFFVLHAGTGEVLETWNTPYNVTTAASVTSDSVYVGTGWGIYRLDGGPGRSG